LISTIPLWLFRAAVVVAVLAIATGPFWLPAAGYCPVEGAGTTPGARTSVSGFAFFLSASSWIGAILMGGPPFYTIAIRFALLKHEAVERRIQAHNEEVARKTGKKIGDIPPSPPAWRLAIDEMSKFQWQMMLTGFALVITAGAVDLLGKGQLAGCM